MQALRLTEVLRRVVAWHNRHPLARRIIASQVHSIGEVILPFASAQALPSPPAAPTPPATHELLDLPAATPGDLAPADVDPLAAHPTEPEAPATAALLPEAGTGPDAEAAAQADSPSASADTPAEPAPVLSMEDEADDLFSQDPPPASEPAAADDDGPEMLIELSSDADEPTPAPAADSPPPAADEPVTDPLPDLSASEADSAELAAAFAAATDDGPAPPAAPDQGTEAGQAPPADPGVDHPAHGERHEPLADPLAQPAEAAPAADPAPARPIDATPPAASLRQTSAASAAPAGFLARLWAVLSGWRPSGASGLPRLQATFSRDFIWPLRPGQVARWARRHGSQTPLAPADWPQRLIDSDASLLAQARDQGLMHPLPLHVLTAAIGVGDRRIRVLIDAQGQVLGPRSYSPPKLAAVASVAALGLLGAGWGWLPRSDSLSAKQTSAMVAAAASAAAQAASAADLAAAAASAAERVWRAQQVESMLAGATPPAAPPAETSQAAAPEQPQPATPAPHGGEAVASAHEPAPAAVPTPAADHGATPPPRKAVVPLGTFVPVLSDAEKLAARQQVEAARNGQFAALAAQPPKQAVPVFAIVTRPSREKESAARSLALMRASGQRLSGEPPDRGELMQNQGEWRAAWWPFESQADAERARVMLAGRGLKVEVVEF